MKIILYIMILSLSLSASNIINKTHSKHMKVINKFYDKIITKEIYNNNYNNECFTKNEDLRNKLFDLENSLIEENIKVLENQNDIKLNLASELSVDSKKNRTVNSTVGISYDLLDEGRAARLNEISTLKNKLILNKLFNSNQLNSRYASEKLNQIIASFSEQKMKFNKDLLIYLKELLEIKKEQNIIHKIKYEDVINVRQMITRLEAINFEYEEFHDNELKYNENYVNCSGGVFDIEINKLLKDMNDQESIDDIETVLHENIDNKYDYVKDMKLQIYAKTNIKDDGSTPGWRAGFSFQIPLYDVKGNMDEIEKQIVSLKVNKSKEDRLSNTRRLYYDYKYKLDDLIKLYYQYEREKLKLKRAMSGYKNGFVKDIDTVISKITDCLAINSQLLEVQQQLYTKAAVIFAASGLKFDSQYVRLVDDEIQNSVIKEETRGVYIWANTFKKYNNNLLVELLKNKNFDEVLVSVSKHQDFKKLKKFVKIIKHKNIKIQLLLSNNKWVKNPDKYVIKRKLDFIKSLKYDLHLDIEMHTFKDWKKRKKFYYKNYLKMLKYISKYKNKKSKINISIPIQYDIKELKKMKRYVNKFYIMAYEIKNTKKMIRKLSKYKSIEKDIVIALNAKEFKNILELELFIKDLRNHYPNYKFTINNLKNLIKIGL